MVSVFTKPDVNTWEVGRTLDKLETTPLRVVEIQEVQDIYISSLECRKEKCRANHDKNWAKSPN